MVVNQSRRISYIGGIVWLMGFGLLAAASIIIAMSLPIPSADVSGVMAWVQSIRLIFSWQMKCWHVEHRYC